ncbi:hypothetical protein ACTWPT_43130 [Nonomuraea sp. 3N208]|uniref:hypothetical protein n=1 Tax=Nonomuraea sp. 3N208 TaxID=3457421 RepID=UPI003FD0C0DC
MTVTVAVLVLVGLGVLDVGGVVVGVFEVVGVFVPVAVLVPVPTTRVAAGPPPDACGWQLYNALLFTWRAKPSPLRVAAPLAVGVTTIVMVGIGMAAPGVRAVAGATVPVATMFAEGNGDPLGLTVPPAITLLPAVISAFAVRTGVAVG